MIYEEALTYLASLGKFGSRPGLNRITKLLDLMGHPEQKYHTIHITGTNGKGSTTAFSASILQAAGIKTGMFTSPHLMEYTERIVVNGQPVSPEEFGQAIGYTKALVDQMLAEGYEHPTEFEIITAAAFYHFAAAQVEYAVIEVGLGGLLDSTNVITPLVSVITNVALEHIDRCGNTVAEIAVHKAGIIKPRVPVVTAAKGEALNVIYSQAEMLHAPLYVQERDFFVQWKGEQVNRQQLTIRTNTYGNLTNLATSLLGRHQADNCAVAVMTAKLIAERDKRITDHAIRRGIEMARWPARFECLGTEPAIIVDAAHNPAGAQTLRMTLDERFEQPITFVFGVLGDKDVAGIIQTLIREKDAVVTVTPLSDRALAAEALAELIPAHRVKVASSIDEAIDMAVNWAGPTGVVCICGSLYLVGSARNIILDRQIGKP